MTSPAAENPPSALPAIERRNGARHHVAEHGSSGDGDSDKRSPRARAFRGLVVSLAFSLLNLAGLFFTARSLGVIGQWSAGQFIGLFGLGETALGLASIVLPNIWRLPVTETDTSRHTRVELAVTSVFVPHWGGLARMLAGLALLLVFGAELRINAGVLLVVPMVLSLALLVIGVSLIAARLGVARPDVDVMRFTVDWLGRNKALPGISLGASIVQFLLGIATLPLADLLSPQELYNPQLGPSVKLLAGAGAAALLMTALALYSWRGRMKWRAHAEQQADIEENA